LRSSGHSRSRRIRRLAALLILGGAVLPAHPTNAQVAPSAALDDPLSAGFRDPPNSARPRVWWHWLNGNVTKDGIAKDLDWMKRVGIGGLQNFDVGLTQQVIVDQKLDYMTPAWKGAFRFAAATADRLGLEMTIASSPGWSETGGPWVQPRDAMKKLVWSDTTIAGGKHFHGRLPDPPQVTGDYLSLARANQQTRFYGDALVLAFPQISSSIPAPDIRTGTGEAIDAGALGDDDLASAVTVRSSGEGGPPAVLVSYRMPQTMRSATLFVRNAGSIFAPSQYSAALEVRRAGEWRPIADAKLGQVPTTIAFDPVSAREFRISFRRNAPGARPLASVQLADLRLSPLAMVDQFETKAGFAVAPDYYALSAKSLEDTPGLSPGKVVNITSRMSADGVLDWTPPRGSWRVLRLGYSLLGTTNHPAAPEATGLEVDKYDRLAVASYMSTYLGMYRDAVGPGLLGSRGVKAILTDSIEVGPSNWTPKMVSQFRQLRGYDPTPWLPALTGVIIGSRARSDAFLYDFRRTLSDLIAREHYGEVARAAHQAGLSVYGESNEGGRTSLGDDMAMRAHADIPMAALWTFDRAAGPSASFIADLRGAASVAHVYGREFVAAESLTSKMKPWAFAPADLQPIIDVEFANGINRPVIHTSVHQPTDRAPGISLSIFGQYFNRHESWAELARPWVDYIARNSFMLQQGRNVADVAYFSGEEAPLTELHGDEPVHFAYDFVNADMVKAALRVEDGAIVSTGGARYRLLYLGGSSRTMTLGLLRKLSALAQDGAIILGERPDRSPSLADDPREFERLARRLWSGAPVTQVGKGKVFAGKNIEATLAQIGALPDVAAAGDPLSFVHRRLSDGDLYFVSNRLGRATRIDARFRVNGRQPEIWHADTGLVEPVSYRIEGAQTFVPFDLGPDESLFVVFRKPATAQSAEVAKPTLTEVSRLTGPWNVAFQPGRGAPAAIRLPELTSLTEQADPGVKYFSGLATYATTVNLPAGTRAGTPLWLDLGKVGDVAEVRVNGTLVGTAWKAPYRVDIGPMVRTGSNAITIRVANLWVNRLIGDAQPGAQKIGFTMFPTYGPTTPLRPSGLIGPVRLLASAPEPRH